MSTFAPLQFLKSAQNPLVWTAVDNGTDSRTSLIIYTGNANTLPSDTGLYEVNCIMMHQAEKQLYSNTGTSVTPIWKAFGPGSAFPQPLVPGTFLFTDGATVYWATSLVGQVQYNGSNLNTYGILNFNDLLVATNDVPNSRINVDLDVVSLANNSLFITTLTSNSTFISNVSTALLALSSFITNLVTTLLANSTFITGITNIVNTSPSIAIDLTSQVTGLLPAANINIADLITQLNDNVTVAVDGVTVTGDGTTANPLVAVVSSDNFTVKATSADTTPSYLDDKINIHSTDGSVTVTKTITNPAGNEVVDYDLSVPSNTGGIVNTRTAISIFQDFNGEQISSSGGGTSAGYGGLYPFFTVNSNAQKTEVANHPGVIDFITNGTATAGFYLLGLDQGDLSLEGMFYIANPGANISFLQIPFNLATGHLDIILSTNSGDEYSVNGSTLASCTYLTGWNTFKVLYNSAGTSCSFYLNNVLISSSLPANAAGAAGTFVGSNVSIDYLSVNATITR